MNLSDLTGEQTRQAIDVDQIFAAYREARDELDRRYAGSMSWKTVRGREYLYRKRRDAWKSLGPRTAETEEAFARFHANRERLRDRVEGLAARIDAMAPVNRALRLGRLPVIAARILRSLARAHLSDTAITVVGTNALFVYERLAGVQIEGSYLATADVDLLFDARSSLKLLAPDVAASGVMGLLRKLDHSFDVMGRGGFRAVNRDGYIVDLIMAAGKDQMKAPARSRIGSDQGDLQAVEIEGLSWLVNSPKVTGTVIDARGYPLEMRVPDPRAFALHKAWLADRPDRDPARARRDLAQAELVAELLRSRLPHLPFDDAALAALPQDLRERASSLSRVSTETPATKLEPDW